MGSHYVLLTDDTDNNHIWQHMWQKKKYVIVDIDNILISNYYDKDNNKHIPVGIYDLDTETWDKGELLNWDNLFKKMSNIWEQNPNIDKIVKDYWVNITTNEVINPSRGIIPVGLLKRHDDSEHFYIEFS